MTNKTGGGECNRMALLQLFNWQAHVQVKADEAGSKDPAAELGVLSNDHTILGHHLAGAWQSP